MTHVQTQYGFSVRHVGWLLRVIGFRIEFRRSRRCDICNQSFTIFRFEITVLRYKVIRVNVIDNYYGFKSFV